MRPSTSIVAALALASSAAAEMFITEPVATTVCTGGAVCNVRWNDDGKAPALKDIGLSEVALYVGGQTQQTFLQMINPSLDVSTASSVSWTVDPAVGENGQIYFVRVTSKALKSTVTPQFPYQSFSAKFELKGMTGTFNATVQSQVDGLLATASAAPTSAAAPGTTAAGTTAASGTTTKPATGASVTTVQSTTKPTTTANSTSSAASALVPVTGFMTGVSTAMTAAAAVLGMIAFGL